MPLFASLLAAGLFAAAGGQTAAPADPPLRLEACRVAGVDEELRCGTFHADPGLAANRQP